MNTHTLRPSVALLICTSSLITFLFAASPASALIDAELSIGRRTAKWQQDTTSSTAPATVFRLAAHLDPIPLVPIGFGLALYSENWQVSAADQGLSSLASYSIVPEIKAWLPMEDLKPYVRLGYSVASAYRGEASLGATTGTISFVGVGLRAGAGLDWSIPVVPLLSALLEVEYSDERLKLVNDKVNNVDVSSNFKSLAVTSTAILIGAKLGF